MLMFFSALMDGAGRNMRARARAKRDIKICSFYYAFNATSMRTNARVRGNAEEAAGARKIEQIRNHRKRVNAMLLRWMA